METNLNNLKKLLNTVEEELGFQLRTDIFEMNDKAYLFKMPSDWCLSSYMISLYSLLIRVGRWYDGKQSTFAFLQNFNALYDDSYLINTAMSGIKKVFETKLFKQNWPNVSGGVYIHNKGICAYIDADDLLK